MRRRSPLIAGGIGALLALVSLVYLFTSPRKGALLAFASLELVGGREASIPAALALGLDWKTAALAATLFELTSLFVLYPVLVGIAAGLHKWPALERMLERAQRFARRNPDVDALALGALTLFPFLPIGALTSALVGELLRLPARVLLPVLAGAIVLGNVAVAYAAARLISAFPRPELVAAAMTFLVLAAAGLAWLAHKRERARERAE